MIKRIGKYEIVRELGSGATSTVYLALDHFNKQQVAIKLFNPDSWRDSITATPRLEGSTTDDPLLRDIQDRLIRIEKLLAKREE